MLYILGQVGAFFDAERLIEIYRNLGAIPPDIQGEQLSIYIWIYTDLYRCSVGLKILSKPDPIIKAVAWIFWHVKLESLNMVWFAYVEHIN